MTSPAPGADPGPSRSRFGVGLLRAETSREGDRATTLELFFDLVYAFAFTQVTAVMAHDETGLGVLQGLILLGLLWAPWSSFAWLANQAHADRGVVRLGMIAATFIMLFASLAIPTAFRDPGAPLLGALLFGVAFFLVQLVHAVVYLVAAGSDTGLRRQVLITEATAILPTGILLVIGGWVRRPWQLWIWLAAVCAGWGMIYLTSRGGDWRINSVTHFAERHGLVVMLALGESVLAIGGGVARLPLDGAVLLGAGLGIAIGVGLWWLYFDHAASGVEHAVARRRGVALTGISTDVYTYLHFPLITGTVIAALGIETTIGHLAGGEASGLFAACALAGGVSLYLAGTAVIWLRVAGEWSLPRFGAALLLLLLIPALAGAPAPAALGAVLAVVVALVVAEAVLGQRAKVHRS